MKTTQKIILFSATFFLFQSSFACEPVPSTKPWYLTANTGMFTGTYNIRYTDQTDAFQQNISETIQQKGYTGGLGVGYSKTFHQTYFLGAEFSGGWMSNFATYQSGSSTSAITDKIGMENYVDLVFVPGLFFTQSLAGYLKIGPSWAEFSDSFTTPVYNNYVPQFVSTTSTKRATGFTTSIGLKKWLTPTLGIFAEYNYRDYGSLSFSNFQNFAVTYSRSIRAYGQNVLLGIDYQIR